MTRRSRRRLALICLCVLPLGAATPARAEQLPRSTPEEQGIAGAAILEFVEELDKFDQLNSLMLLRHGRVVAEGWWRPYEPQHPHTLYSLSKSFTSTAVGLAIAEGELSLDDPVLDFFPGWGPARPSDNLKAMRVRDLLNMNAGQHAEDVATIRFDLKESQVKAFLNLPVPHKPGTHFVYNTPASYVCSAIVNRATGQSVNEYLQTRLYEPLGIERPRWESTAEGVSQGGFGLHLKTEDIAKFGQLLLQRGRWGEGDDARQIVPAEWIDLATSRQTSNGSNPASDWDQGYGYQFWRCQPRGVYRGDGAFGQYCIVMPEQDAVLAMTGGTGDMQGVMNVVWRTLAPALSAAAPLPADEDAGRRLAERLAGLVVPTPDGEPTSPRAEEFAGKTFKFAPNVRQVESIRFNFAEAGSTIALRAKGRDYAIACAGDSWGESGVWPRLAVDLRGSSEDSPAAGAGAWTSPNVYFAKIVQYETPYYQTLRCEFLAGEVVLTMADNVAFWENKPTTLVGKIE